jgi:predicted MFS family arabinose efflux permease
VTEAADDLQRPLRSLARHEAWRWWVVSCFVARLPVTMSVVALVLSGRRLGSFSVGAALAGVSSLFSGAGAWWRARAMDRNELRAALRKDLAITAAGWGVVAVLVHARAPVLVVGAAIAGASLANSALFAGYRSMLPMTVPPHLVPSAYAVDAVLVEVSFVCGPAIAGLLSLAVGASGVLFAMSLAGAAAAVFTRWLPRREPHPPAADGARAPAPWSEPELVANYLGTFAIGMMIGLFEAGFAPFAVLLGHRDGLGGVLSGAYAFGSGVGGLFFATRLAHRQGHARRAVVLMVVLGLLLLPVSFAPSLGLLVPILIIAGLPFATANAAGSSHLQSHVHPARSTEGFALATMCVLLGVAGGNALTSVVLHAGWSPRTIYLLAAVPPVVAAAGIAVWAIARRRAPAAP